MKLSDVNIDKTEAKISKILRWHIGRTEEAEELLQIELIEAGLENDRQLGILNEKEYNKARIMLCDIALNYFKNHRHIRNTYQNKHKLINTKKWKKLKTQNSDKN